MAEPATHQRPLSFEDAAHLDPDRHAGELVEGVWIPGTRSTWRHGEIALNAAAVLRGYARANPGWRVAVGDPGARLQQDPDTLRGPDVAMIREERRPTGKGVEGWLDGAPELAVEVIGTSQSLSELTAKALEYLRAGGRMVWVIDPEPERVVLFTAPDHVRVLAAGDTLDGGEALPGFSYPVSDLFE